MKQLSFAGALLALVLPAIEAQADSTTWELAKGVTSAGLATVVTENPLDEKQDKWGLVSSSTVYLSDQHFALVTFWRGFHDSSLDADTIYRCVDVLGTDATPQEAFCQTPRTRRGE